MSKAGGRVMFIGSKKVAATLKKLGKRSEFALGKALYEEGEEIMAESKAGFVPRDTSALAASGHVQLPTKGPLVLMGYGGPSVAYALIQHEAHYRHKIGQRKYLEIPVIAAIPGMPKRIAISLDKTLIKTAARGR